MLSFPSVSRLLTCLLLLAACGTVQRNEAYPSTEGGFFLQKCLYDAPLTPTSVPLKCKLLCKSPTRIPASLIEQGVCTP